MSLFGALLTSVSGMNAQSVKLGTVADNISNSSTVGYKQASAQFETLIGAQSATAYAAGGVNPVIRYAVNEQGTLESTTSTTDLAVQGNGFFVVTNNDGRDFLTRAGSFVPDNNGNLVNTAGFYLMGKNLVGSTTTTIDGLADLTKVNVNQTALTALPSTTAVFTANLPANASVVAATDLPSANAATSTYTAKNSLVAYDNLGGPVTIDLYFSKTAANTWEVSAYNRADAAASGGFPYANPALLTQQIDIDPTTGRVTGAASAPLSLTVPNGGPLSLDLSATTQLSAPFSVVATSIDGHAPSSVDHIQIGKDGLVSAIYKSGATVDLYKIPLADTVSPDNMTALDGNVYAASQESGDIRVGAATTGGFGNILSDKLENSTVDLGAELTKMIETQRAYTANTKVFQASADLLNTLNQFQV